LALPPRPPPVTASAPAPSHPLAAAGPRSLPTRSTPGAAVGLGLTVTGLLGFGVLMGLIPLGVREGHRRWRMHLVGAGGPRAVSAAWQELLAESADRRVVPPVGETVRATAQRLVDEHGLDEAGQAGLRVLVDAVERTWYASALDAATGRRRGGRRSRDMNCELRAAMTAVLTSMVQSAPLTRTARLLPRSVLWRPRARYRDAG
jgi:hypothetical protein